MDTLIDLKRLQHLVLLSEELNFSRAAKRAFLSQTAFSRSIQALEADFGVRMFDRGTRSVQITTAGRQLNERARVLLARARDLTQEANYLAQAKGGQLSFGASQFAVDSVLPGLIPSFCRDRPNLRVDVEVSNWEVLLKHLEAEEIEFFIAYPGHLRSDARFSVKPLNPRPASLFCHADHPLMQLDDEQRHPAKVQEYPWAIVQIDDLLISQLRLLFSVPANKALPIALRSDSQKLLHEAVIQSNTILFTWQAWLETDLQSGSIVDIGKLLQPAIPAAARQLEIGIVTLADRSLSPAAQELLEIVVSREIF